MKRIAIRLVASAGLGLCLAVSGCVIMDSTLTLEHMPAMDTIARAPHAVFLARVTDRRSDPGRIGCKKNGYGSESATLELDVSVADWFGGVLNEEIRRSGLTLAGAQDAGAARVEIDLLDFFIEPTTGMFQSYHIYAVVHAEVTVRFPDGTGYARRYATHADDTSLLPTDGSYEEVMQQAMSGWVRQTVTDIVGLIEFRQQAGASLQALPGRWKVMS